MSAHSLTDITNPTPLDPMLGFLERALRDPQFSTEKAEAVMRLLVEQQRRVQLQAFNLDMNLMQEELQQIPRDKSNPVFHSKYATYEQLDRIARPIYTKYGFSIRFGTAPASQEGWVQITCTISHRNGFFEQHSLEGPISTEGSQGRRAGATPIQALGSAVTYLKRYLLSMVLNLVTSSETADDNDGNRSPPPPNGDRDPLAKYIDWTDRFEQAAQNLTDSDQAKELLNRPTVVTMLTEMPHGTVKQRFMSIRQDIEKMWLKPVENAPENKPADTSNDIEGL